MDNNFHRWQQNVLILELSLQPNARHDAWVGLHNSRLKLKITALAIEGRANAYLLDFLAKEFGVAKQACQIVAGETGRHKRVAIKNPQRFPQLPNNLQLYRETTAAPAVFC
jgi:uncharacterized protein (TIGR00251 family)